MISQKKFSLQYVRERSEYLYPLLICIVVLIVYGHTLSVPFYMDDYSSIVDNPVITQQEGITALWLYCKLRVVGYLTFAANYSVNGLHVSGYHVVNILIHCLAGFSVLWLITGLIKVPVIREKSDAANLEWLPLVVALIFVLHPLQTQSVTYIVQRLTSLAALFYISSLSCFIYAKLFSGTSKGRYYISGCGVFALLAFFTKQNTLSLPLSMILVECLFFSDSRRNTLRTLLLLSAGMFALWVVMASLFHMNPLSLSSLERLTQETELISRQDYFFTQVRVLWIYIGLFFWPAGLHLDHDIALSHSLAPDVLIGLSGHLLVIAIAILLVRRVPIVSFGVLFFYFGHSIESSFIPIRDVLFEHRTYLPNLGLSLVTGWFLVQWLPGMIGKKAASVFIVTLCLLLAAVTWSRNATWRDPVKLWRDSAVHAPDKARPWSELGRALLLEGDNVGALEVFLQATGMSHGPNETGAKAPRLDESAAVNMIVALVKGGEYELSLFIVDKLLEQHVTSLNRSKMLTNKGNVLYKLMRLQEAEFAYREAFQVYEGNYIAMNNLGYILLVQDRLDEAEEVLAMVKSSSPYYEKRNKIFEKIQKRRKALR